MNTDYTIRARRMALRHPLLSNIFTQIFFWIFAFGFYFTLLFFTAKAITSLFALNVTIHNSGNMFVGFITAIAFGIILGIIDYYIDRKFRRKSFGIEFLVKFILYTAAWFSVTFFARTIGFALQAQFIQNPLLNYSNEFFENIGLSSTIYTVVMIVIISFVKQMNTKFGPGVLLPMFFGKYREPRVEERIFMFMDLTNSTSHAEKLGHIKYSELIQNCFLDANKIMQNYFAEIYQYVGDEIVLSWTADEGFKNYNCIEYFFAFKNYLQTKKKKYEEQFGLVPEFKAALHFGKITVVEVGDIKREIAYHGDTINIASRIQTLCKTYNQNLLISESLTDVVSKSDKHKLTFIDDVLLKGKTEKVKLYTVEKI